MSSPTHAEAVRFFDDKILMPFVESSLYRDYQEVDGWTDEQFDAYLKALREPEPSLGSVMVQDSDGKWVCDCCMGVGCDCLDPVCDGCGNRFEFAGDGYAGLCPSCADRRAGADGSNR